jgi:peptidoglycan/LPS O-acetylase OafA/YrhL
LTSVRFLAASHVVLYHFVSLSGLPWFVAGIVGSGYTGVSFFFVLSGFVLAYNYLRPGSAVGFDKTKFWVARFARIYPVYVFALSIGFAVALYELHASHESVREYIVKFGQFLVALTMQQAWTTKTATVLDPPAWSLSDEAFFYLLFPWLGLALFKQRTVHLAGAVGVFWLLSLAGPVLYLISNTSVPGFWLDVVKFTPLFRLPEFLVGVAAGVLFGRLGPLGNSAAAWVTTAAGGLLIIVLGVSAHLPYGLLHNGLLSPLYALLIVGLASGGGRVGRLLSRRLPILLGEASYALYLLQVPLWVVVAVALRAVARPFGHNLLLTFPVFLPIVLVASVCTYLLIEKPARRRIREQLTGAQRRLTRATERAVASVPTDDTVVVV